MQTSFLQTPFWACLKEKGGWEPFQVENIWILEKNLPFGKSFLYSPETCWNQIVGHSERSEESLANASISNKLSDSSSLDPSMKFRAGKLGTQNDIQNFVAKIEKNIKNSSTIFFRLEILDEFDDKIVEKLKKNGFVKAFEEVQPEWRQIIDISKSEEEILAQMKQKGRYNIKVAQKHNVKVEKTSGVDKFYENICQTAKRDGFEIRPKKYFEDLMEVLSREGVAEVWQARYNNKVVAALIAVFYSGVATYLYGASSSEYRNVMAPYLLHWQVILRAKEQGCKEYDLLAVAPPPLAPPLKGGENHKYAGITRFKEQFGGRKKHIIGSYDLVHKPFWYKLFKVVEKYRRK